MFETGANDVLVVKKDDAPKNEEKLLPFIAAVVLEVDLEAKTMLVDWDEEF